MDKQLTEANLAFLERCQLQGSEVPVYNALRDALVDQLTNPAPQSVEVVKETPELAEK